MDFIINRLSLGRNFENFLEKNSKRKSKFHPKKVPRSRIKPGPPGWQPAIVSTTPTWLVVGNASFPQIKTIREYNSIISVGERANTHYTTLDPKLSTRSLRSLDWWILGLEWYNSCYARSPTNIILSAVIFELYFSSALIKWKKVSIGMLQWACQRQEDWVGHGGGLSLSRAYSRVTHTALLDTWNGGN